MTNGEATGEHRRSFGPTHGVTSGWLGIALCAVIFVMALWQDPSKYGVQVALGAVLVAWLLYVLMLRPRIFVDASTITLRGAFADRAIPLSSITHVLVGAYVKVLCDHQKFTSSAVGQQRPKRSLALSVPKGPPATTEADAFQAEVDRLLESWRDRHDQAASTLTWSVRELAITVAFAVAFVLSLLI